MGGLLRDGWLVERWVASLDMGGKLRDGWLVETGG